MARHQVKSFRVGISPSGSSVQVVIETELQKPYKFELNPDSNYPTVQVIEKKLKEALNHCVETYEKAEISVFKERSYVSINVKNLIDTRFTGNAG